MRLLVHFRPDASAAERDDAVRSVGGWIDAEIPALGVTRIALPGDADDAFGDGPAVAAALAAHPAVAHAELDRVVHLTFAPNDQYYATDPYSGLGQWGIRKAFVDKAWDSTRGAAGVVVAVLDTGVDPAHPDLAGALAPGATFLTQVTTGCDGAATKDDNSHGTHVAGIVAASGNNGLGIAGVAFGVRVMPLKVLDCTGMGELSDVASGIVYATDHGARIINLSLGSPFESTTLRAAVTYAAQHNVLIVSAVGNCGTTSSSCTSLNEVQYAAAYPEVLAVGATDTDDSVAFFSSRNSTTDISAPGRKIVSTTPTYATYLSTHSGATLSYAAFSGTSQASPFVSGVAALVWSADPTLTATQVYQRLVSTADDLGPAGRDDGYGFGRVNGLRAVQATTAERYGATYDTSAVPKSVATGSSFVARVGLANSSSFTWSAADPTNAVRLAWSWSSPSLTPVATPSGTLPLPADVPAGASATVTGVVVAPSTAGPYTLRFDLVRGTTAFSSKGVAPASVAAVVGSGLGATYAAPAGTASFDLGTPGSVTVSVTNTGSVTWPAGGPTPVHLSYHWLQNGALVQWDGLRASLPADVALGGRATVAVPVLPPVSPGAYTLRLDLVQEGIAWFSGAGVIPLDLPANVRSALVATYALDAVPAMLPGGRLAIPVTLTNIGTATWSAAGAMPVHVAAHISDSKGNVVSWDGARTVLAADVAPGAKVTTAVTVDAPLAAGAYRVRVDTVEEGVAWFSSLGVATADADLFVTPDLRAQLTGGPITVSRASPVAQVTITNTGIATWTPTGAAPVDVGVHWYDARGSVLVWDGPRTALPGPVAAGASVTLAVQLGAAPAGAAFVAVDLVAEGVAWAGQGPLRLVTFAP